MTDPLTLPEPADGSPEPEPLRRRRSNVRRWWTVAAVVTAVCLSLVVGAGYVLTRVLSTESCDASMERESPGLSSLPELQLHPPQATPRGVPAWDCDVDRDEENWFVAQRFESTADPRATLAYYRKALSAAGWDPVKDIGEGNPEHPPLFEGPDGIVCFIRDVGGSRVYLLVDYPKPDQRGINMYALNASRATVAAGGCGFY